VKKGGFQALASRNPRDFRLISLNFSTKWTGKGLFALPLRVFLPKWWSFFFSRVCNGPMATLVRLDAAQESISA